MTLLRWLLSKEVMQRASPQILYVNEHFWQSQQQISRWFVGDVILSWSICKVGVTNFNCNILYILPHCICNLNVHERSFGDWDDENTQLKRKCLFPAGTGGCMLSILLTVSNVLVDRCSCWTKSDCLTHLLLVSPLQRFLFGQWCI